MLPRLARHAQLTLQLRRALAHALLERLVRLLKLREKTRAPDRARRLVRDDRNEILVVLRERARHRSLDREDADELVAHEERDRDLALGVRKPRHGNVVAQLGFATR